MSVGAVTQPAAKSRALSHIRICDLTGLLAGAGATRFLAAFGAQVIRVEQPTHEKHRWDFLRGGMSPDGTKQGINFGGNFNNHNVEKLGVTLDLKSAEGKALLGRLVAVATDGRAGLVRHPAQQRLLAIRASKLDAYRSLTEQVYGQQLDATTTVADMTVMSDTFRAKVEGVIYGAVLVSIAPVGEDTYETTLSLDQHVVRDLRSLYLNQLAARRR